MTASAAPPDGVDTAVLVDKAERFYARTRSAVMTADERAQFERGERLAQRVIELLRDPFAGVSPALVMVAITELAGDAPSTTGFCLRVEYTLRAYLRAARRRKVVVQQ